MTRFCIVAPTQVLEELDNGGVLGGQHLLLAHDVVKHPDKYWKLFNPKAPPRRDYRGFAIDYHDQWIIMDNSAIELQKPVDLKMLSEACKIVEPTCAVLPDILEDCEATKASCLEALATKVPYVSSWLMIPQGRTLEEFVDCAEVFAEDTRIKYWGCPRNLVKNIGSRRYPMQALRVLNKTRPIHMMGFSDNMIDDVLVARESSAYSIDSAVPLRVDEHIYMKFVPEPRGDWWERGKVNQHTVDNVKTVRRWFS